MPTHLDAGAIQRRIALCLGLRFKREASKASEKICPRKASALVAAAAPPAAGK
jgi:hypothetical protein